MEGEMEGEMDPMMMKKKMCIQRCMMPDDKQNMCREWYSVFKND